jgi:hypothetical protein
MRLEVDPDHLTLVGEELQVGAEHLDGAETAVQHRYVVVPAYPRLLDGVGAQTGAMTTLTAVCGEAVTMHGTVGDRVHDEARMGRCERRQSTAEGSAS